MANEVPTRAVFSSSFRVIPKSLNYFFILFFYEQMICMMSVMCGNLHSLLLVSNKKVTPSKNKKKKSKNANIATIENEDAHRNNKVRIWMRVLLG